MINVKKAYDETGCDACVEEHEAVSQAVVTVTLLKQNFELCYSHATNLVDQLMEELT